MYNFLFIYNIQMTAKQRQAYIPQSRKLKGNKEKKAFWENSSLEWNASSLPPPSGLTFLVLGKKEKAMAPHSSTFAWKIPRMEEPGGLPSMGSLRVGHDWATLLSLFTFMHWRRKWQPIPVFLPGESQGRGSLVAAVYGVTPSRTRQKWLSIARNTSI